MKTTTSPRNLLAVLKLGGALFVGWLCLWLGSGIAIWLATGTYEGMGFVFLCGVYGFGGAVMFALFGSWQYRYRAFSCWRSVLSAALAGLLALPLVWQFLLTSNFEHLGWIGFFGVAIGVGFGLLLRWLSGLLFHPNDDSCMA